MQADIFDQEKFIKVNNLKQITNPIIIEKDNIPTNDGLLSNEIFGRTVESRRSIFAYIDLHGHFFHPLIYKQLKRMDRRIEQIVGGDLKVIITENGQIVEDEEKGKSGLDFLYANFQKIKYLKNDSNSRNERIDLLNSLKKDEIFMSKLVILPAFYRDIQNSKTSEGKTSYGEINRPYSKLIRLANSLNNDFGSLPIVQDSTKVNIQNTLVEIYDMCTHEFKGKNGIMRKYVMGKSVDNCVRAVISSPLFKVDKYTDMNVNFYHSGIPLSMACTVFYPFVINWIKQYFYNELYLRKDKYPVKNPKGEIEYVKLTGLDEFNDAYFEKNINLFLHSYGDRFKTIPLKNDKGYDIHMKIIGRNVDIETLSNAPDSTIMNRFMTWTDLLYMAAVESSKDKHVMITRYPLEDMFSSFPSLVTVLSTRETMPVKIGDRVYNNYPIIDLDMSKEEIMSAFIDTVKMSNLHLNGLGADYDGDQITVKGVWSVEANRELDELMRSKRNILNIMGECVKTTEKEAIETLYAFTK